MNKLREYRQRAGLSQLQLSYKARVPSTAISSIENNRLAVWPRAAKALSRALKVRQTELFPDNGKIV